MKNFYSKHAEFFVGFKDLGYAPPKRGINHNKLYVAAIARKLGGITNGVPVVLEISEKKVEINVIKNPAVTNNFVSCHGLSYVKNSLKNNQSMRLVTLFSDGSAASFTS